MQIDISYIFTLLFSMNRLDANKRLLFCEYAHEVYGLTDYCVRSDIGMSPVIVIRQSIIKSRATL